MEHAWLRRLRESLWGETETLTRFQHELRRGGRYLWALARDLLDGQISLRAMSLVYTTLLSLVPLLALAFSAFKGFGIHNSLEPVLMRFLAPLGPQGAALTRNIIGFVENIKVGVLGFVGILLLLYTVLSMIQKVEDAFNYIWRVETRRNLGQRIGEYLSLTVIGPLAIFIALGTTASVLDSDFVARFARFEPFGLILFVVGRLIPYAVIVGLFSFLYHFVPNTRVRWHAAFGGGLLAGFLWQSASLAFASFVANAPNYNAIYSGFAIGILLLFWLYLGWLILLVGCQLAYYLQYPERLTPTRIAPQMSARAGEILGFWITALVGRRFLAGEPPVSRDQLHRDLAAVPEHIDRVLEILLHHGVLAESGVDGEQFLPRRDLDSITLADLWKMLRAGFDTRPTPRAELGAAASALVESAENGFMAKVGSQTLRQWLAPRPGSDAAQSKL